MKTRVYRLTGGRTFCSNEETPERGKVAEQFGEMIDTADLQAFLATKVEGGAVAVDLCKIGQSHHQQHAGGSKNAKSNNGNFRVALDMEDCLDRFYGGYYSDWACGGQWSRAYQFVQLLHTAFKNAHVEIHAFFDGSLKKNKKTASERNDFRQKTLSVLKHIRMIATPPPKIWWLPPSGIRTTLRNALRSVNIQVAQTVNDHTMEIIEYFHEQKLDAIIGLHPDYIIANSSRYFSSHDLRLSYKGALETKEFMVSKLLSTLSLTADHLPFVAVLLGGYIVLDEAKLKSIYEKCKIDYSLDFEARIRRIAEIVRNSPTNDIDEFIKHLNLGDYEKDIKESVEYYQRKGQFSGKKYQGAKKRGNDNQKQALPEPAPIASETSETDELTRKILTDVNNLVDEEAAAAEQKEEAEKVAKSKTETKENSSKTKSTFVYTLPGEVIKTSLSRHQRGIMDARIYHLLTKKEIILPQILEDENYREIPSIHLFYRPARQMIYAVLFNLYHQKYLCSKQNMGDKDKKNERKEASGQSHKLPEIQISEWIWSPQNEYKRPDVVTAQALPWAVPTVQRLWFGMAFDDKQRRMRAFLSIMRSDTPLMLNRGYVPQHMLVMACVLRYIVTCPDRTILTRQELDAFLATAFSPQLPIVEYTQELVLPGVHLRGVYLATLFMQGVETASLANDSCGVPLPWTMTNPWLFFDGKLFHLKLKMSTYVTTLRELCDDHIEIVLKIERFRKAILEDVEHYLLPAAHMDPMYRPGFLPPPAIPIPAYNNKNALHSLATAASSNGTIFYNAQAPYFSISSTLLGRDAITGVNTTGMNARTNMRGAAGQQRNGAGKRKDYQLKVGGIVTGSWAAGGIQNRSLFGSPANRLNTRLTVAANRFNVNNRGKMSVNARLQRNQNTSTSNIANRTIARVYGNKLNTRNRNKQKRKENRKGKQQGKKQNTKADQKTSQSGEKSEIKTEIDTIVEKVKNTSLRECTVELRNGKTILASDLANSICDELLKDEEESPKTLKTEQVSPPSVSSPSKPKAETVPNDTGASGDSTKNDELKQAPTATKSATSAAKSATNATALTKKTKAKKNGTANAALNKTVSSESGGENDNSAMNASNNSEVEELGQGDVAVQG